jgi:hypothetical protein
MSLNKQFLIFKQHEIQYFMATTHIIQLQLASFSQAQQDVTYATKFLHSDTFELPETDAMLPLPFFFQPYQELKSAVWHHFPLPFTDIHYNKALWRTQFITPPSVMNRAPATQNIYGQPHSPSMRGNLRPATVIPALTASQTRQDVWTSYSLHRRHRKTMTPG